MCVKQLLNIDTCMLSQRITDAVGVTICRRFSTSPNLRKDYDLVVVGGGIVGTATARELLQRHGKMRMALVEKENRLAVHQTGHNSGVIHAGIYYTPGSLKAKLCVEGLHLTYKYCEEKKIPNKKVGKLIVATNPVEVERLANLHQRGIANKVPELKLLKGEKELKEIEPHCRGLEALWSPHTGIIDFSVVTQHLGKDFTDSGGEIFLNYEVNAFKESGDPNHPVTLTSKSGQSINTKYVLTCGGLQSDYLAQLSGCSRDPRIIPFRGEYLLLTADKRHLVKGNIYPVPDPRFPFLGVHYTPRMDGNIWLGPNALLSFKREGYTWFDIDIKELFDALSYRGFHKIAMKYVGFGIKEMVKSAFPSLRVKDLQKFIPEVTAKDIKRGPAGVRAQALTVDGNLVDDFLFDMGTGPIGLKVLHCRNAPSPGATSSMAIAKMVADKLEKEFNLSQLK